MNGLGRHHLARRDRSSGKNAAGKFHPEGAAGHWRAGNGGARKTTTREPAGKAAAGKSRIACGGHHHLACAAVKIARQRMVFLIACVPFRLLAL